MPNRRQRFRAKVRADVLSRLQEQVHEKVVPVEEASHCFPVNEALEVSQRRHALVEGDSPLVRYDWLYGTHSGPLALQPSRPACRR